MSNDVDVTVKKLTTNIMNAVNEFVIDYAKDHRINVFEDGDQFCATYDDFVDLHESIAGFADSPMQAIIKLAMKRHQ